MAPEADLELHEHRLHHASLIVKGCDGTISMRARSGELQGDHAAPKRFVKLTSDVVGPWVEERRKVDENAALD
eukprot:2736835-Heterocapsa_arctica.AAC.1